MDSDRAWPRGPASPDNHEAVLPPFDSIFPARSFIDVFARGSRPLNFHTAADQPWVILSEAPAPGAGINRRIWVSIDWEKAPVGTAQSFVTVTGANGTTRVKVTSVKATPQQERDAGDCFGGLVGPIAFAAESATKNVAVNGVRWQRIPGYGRGVSGVEVFPVTAETVQPPDPRRISSTRSTLRRRAATKSPSPPAPPWTLWPTGNSASLSQSAMDLLRSSKSSRPRRAVPRASWDKTSTRTMPTMPALCASRRRLLPPGATRSG